MIGTRRKRRGKVGRRKKPKGAKTREPMLPSGFKKDSRVWLHKNPTSRAEDVDKTAVLRRFLDSERSFNENSPCYFVELQGKQFKKDSRSWLHKSSLKKHQSQKSRRKGPGPVAGDCCRQPELARSNTDVRLSFQQEKLLKRKCGAFHASDGDIISNDYGLRQVMRKKRVDNTLHGGLMQLRRPHRTLSEERLNEEVNNIMNYASLNTFGQETDGERVTELADDTVGIASEEEENSNHPSHLYRSDGQEFEANSYTSLTTCNLWRDTVGVKSDTSSSGHSKGSMDTLAPGFEDLYNVNAKGVDKPTSPDLISAVTDQLQTCHSGSRSSVGSLCAEHAQLKLMSLCASPPGSPCSDGSISEEDLKSSDIDI